MALTTERRQGEIAYRILIAVLKDGAIELPSFRRSGSSFACQAVSSEFRKLFEDRGDLRLLSGMIFIEEHELEAFAQRLYSELGWSWSSSGKSS